MLQFQRTSASPVLAKGSTYDTWVADAIAAPSACWDGTRWAMTVSLWDNTRAKWASAFFTSPDLATWTYVSSSLRQPQGTDYLLGNGGLVWWNNKYWFAYSHYQTSPGGITLQTSTDLLAWTTVGDPLPVPVGSGWFDPSLSINPNNGRLELWFGKGADRSLWMADSPDGTTFTSRGQFWSTSVWNAANFGEWSVFYYGGIRYITFDGTAESGRRSVCFAYSVNSDTTWVTYGSCLGADPLNSWESINVFDSCCVGAADLGDGRGLKLRMVYAGGNVVAAGDATSSSIGLVWMDLPGSPVAITAAGQSGSIGSGTIYASRSLSAAGISRSFASKSALGRTTLVVTAGMSGSSSTTASMTVTHAQLKVSPRLVTITDTSTFTGTATIARRS